MRDAIPNNYPDKILLLFHEGCERGHWKLSDIRRCGGKFVHSEDVTQITYYREIRPELSNDGNRKD